MVIGFRSFPDGLAYVILEGTQSAPEVITRDRLELPKNHTWPACLSWVRKQLSEILQAHDVKGACIKAIEPMAQKKSDKRLYIEAIITEYLHSAKALDCTTRIKSQLKRDIKGFTDPARYLDRALSSNDLLRELNTPQYQEATLAALSELPEN